MILRISLLQWQQPHEETGTANQPKFWNNNNIETDTISASSILKLQTDIDDHELADSSPE
jgi:hypothetical protein